MKKFLYLLAALQLTAVAMLAQPYYPRRYQVENGLSHNTVFCVTQDKSGFIWVGTKDGLNRFDGYQFRTFPVHPEKDGPVPDHILSVTTDREGTLWAGTQKGLFYFDADREKFVPFLDTVHSINDIFFDSKGQLWFIANSILRRYDFRQQQLEEFPPKDYFNATSFCETPDGSIWFSSREGYLHRYNASSHTFDRFNLFAHSPAVQSAIIQKILCDGNGNIIVGTRNQGIKYFRVADLDYTDVLTHSAGNSFIYVHDIVQANDHETWFATENGIFIRNSLSGEFTQLEKRFLDPYTLSDNAVYTLYKDTEGGIWAGTFFGGLNYFPNQHASFQKFYPDYTSNSLSGNAVREICEDNRGNLWIGTEDAGLNKLNLKTGEITRFLPQGRPGTLSDANIQGLLVVGNELWIGTFLHGLDVMDIRTGKIIRHYKAGTGQHGLKNNFIISLYRTRNGDIYAGTVNGLCRYDRETDTFVYPEWVAPGSFVPCIFEDHEGTIWVATHHRGLFYYNPVTGKKGAYTKQPGEHNSLPVNSINSIYEDSRHALWLATEGGGLCKLNPASGQFTRYTTGNGLPGNLVFKVLEDNRHSLWITTSKGLVKMDPETGNTTTYLKANGLLNDQFNYNSGYKDQQGNLYFGSVEGMIRFHPDDFVSRRFTAPVCITGMQVRNREIDITKDSSILTRSIVYTDEIVLPYDQSSFSIDFAAMSFTAPEITGYSYIMNGLDKEWTHLSSNRRVYFTNLKPGSYIFQVKAGKNGAPGSKIKTLAIVITPPLWATTWAYMVYVVLLGLLAWYFIRTYHHIQENKKEKEIYHAKMDFFTNIAHEIKTPLTLIKGPVENLAEMTATHPDIEDDVHTMERNVDRLLNLSNQILDFRQTETKAFSLDFAEVNLGEMLRDAHVLFEGLARKRNLDYRLEIPAVNVYMMADAEALTKVFHNLFSNAVKYAHKEVTAILHAPGKNEPYLVIEISNDGYSIPAEVRKKIFEPFFRIRENNKPKGTGLGLALARSLVELHGGKIYVSSASGEKNIFIVELPYKTSTS